MSLVYVADDEPALGEMLAEMLEEEGHAVEHVQDGPSLLARVGAKSPDLILLDINMPGMDGWEVRRRLLENPASARIPVIAVTAQGGAGLEASALKTLAFCGFVRKPFRMADLLDQVEGALGQKGA